MGAGGMQRRKKWAFLFNAQQSSFYVMAPVNVKNYCLKLQFLSKYTRLTYKFYTKGHLAIHPIFLYSKNRKEDLYNRSPGRGDHVEADRGSISGKHRHRVSSLFEHVAGNKARGKPTRVPKRHGSEKICRKRGNQDVRYQEFTELSPDRVKKRSGLSSFLYCRSPQPVWLTEFFVFMAEKLWYSDL